MTVFIRYKNDFEKRIPPPIRDVSRIQADTKLIWIKSVIVGKASEVEALPTIYSVYR